jgi:hypothetical protein
MFIKSQAEYIFGFTTSDYPLVSSNFSYEIERTHTTTFYLVTKYLTWMVQYHRVAKCWPHHIFVDMYYDVELNNVVNI